MKAINRIRVLAWAALFGTLPGAAPLDFADRHFGRATAGTEPQLETTPRPTP